MSQSPDPAAGGPLQQSAAAFGEGQVNQAGRDLYLAAGDLIVYGGLGRSTPHTEAVGDGEPCPYPGLAPFGVDQAQWYFGRGPLIGEVVAQLAAGSPVTVVGPSGSGKSSLLMAGLRPALSNGRFPSPGSREWPQLALTPTAHPVTALAEQLATVTEDSVDALRTDPGGYASRLRDTLAARSGVQPQRLIVIVDQLEELFTLCGDDSERRCFIDAVSEMSAPAAGRDLPPVLFLLGLRADFYGHAIAIPQLRAMLRERQVLVGPMTEDELRSAIVEPAAATGLAMEPGLEELLLRDLGVFPGDPAVGDPDPDTWFTAGRLPLLAHALHMTWVQRSRNALTVADYQATGGIRQAISTTAERSYASLDTVARQAAEALFLRLVRIGHSAEDTRRRASLAELSTDGSTTSATAAALTAFTRARLLTVDGDRAADRVTVQITHEALIRAWPRLRRWIDRGRSDILIRQELEEAARAWSEHGRFDPALLYRGSRLERASTAAAATPDHVSRTARDFLAASALQAARAARLRRGVIAVLTALALIASGAAVFAFQQRATAQSQRDTARKERDTAVAGQISIEADRVRSTDPSLAARLDLASYRMRPDDAEYTNLLSWEDQPLATLVPGAVGSPAFSADGKRMATRGADGSVSVWDSRSPSHPRLLGRPVPGLKSGSAVQLSRDGRQLAVYARLDGSGSGSPEHAVFDLWDVSDPTHFRHTGTLPGTEMTTMVGFSSDGRRFITADREDAPTTTLWDITDPARPRPTTRPGLAVALSHDGRTLAVWDGSDLLQLVDVSEPDRSKELLAEGLNVGGSRTPEVSFSADGRWLATSDGSDGNGEPATLDPETTRVWDLADRTHPTLHNEHQGGAAVLALALRPDGQILATGGSDRTITLWRVGDTGVTSSSLPDANPYPLQEMYTPLSGQDDNVSALQFTPDGAALASSDDTAVRIWSLPHTVAVPGGDVDSLTIPAGDRTLVTGIAHDSSVAQSSIGLWNITGPRGPAPDGRPIVGPDIWPSVSAVTADGRTLATVGKDQTTITLWNLSDPTHPTPVSRSSGSNSGNSDIVQLAFTAGGTRLWSRTPTGTSLWSVQNRSNPQLIEPTSPMNGDLLTASTDDHLAVTDGAPDGTRLWDTSDPAKPVVLSTLAASGYAPVVAAISADSHTLALSRDRTVQLWDISDPRKPVALGSPMTGHSDQVTSMTFVPHQPLLATAGADSTVRLWDLSNPRKPTAKGRPLPAPDAGPLAFTHDGQTMITSDVAGTLRTWDLRIEHATARICDTTDNILTQAVWNRHFPDIPYQHTCS